MAYPSFEGLPEAYLTSCDLAWVFELEAYHPFDFVFLTFVVILRSQVEYIHLDGFHE
jgi:hypothetical protein